MSDDLIEVPTAWSVMTGHNFIHIKFLSFFAIVFFICADLTAFHDLLAMGVTHLQMMFGASGEASVWVTVSGAGEMTIETFTRTVSQQELLTAQAMRFFRVFASVFILCGIAAVFIAYIAQRRGVGQANALRQDYQALRREVCELRRVIAFRDHEYREVERQLREALNQRDQARQSRPLDAFFARTRKQ